MTLPELIKRILDAGASTKVVAIVTEAFEVLSGTSPGQVRDIQRRYERERKQKQRKKSRKNKQIAEANDAAISRVNVRDKERDGGKERCDSSFLPSLLSESPSNRESKKEANTRARGTRLSADAVLSVDDRQFAIDNGVRDVDAAWAEFRDYWIGVPGQRGTKLDWSATWRNRVRQISTKNGGYNGASRGSSRSGATNRTDNIRTGMANALARRPESRLFTAGDHGEQSAEPEPAHIRRIGTG